MTLPERLLSGVSALFLMFSGWRTDLIGLALLAILVASAYWRFTRLRNRTGTSAFAPGAPASENEPAVGLTAARPQD